MLRCCSNIFAFIFLPILAHLNLTTILKVGIIIISRLQMKEEVCATSHDALLPLWQKQ